MILSLACNAELPSAGYRKVSEKRRLALDLIGSELAEIDEDVLSEGLWIREGGKVLGAALRYGHASTPTGNLWSSRV